MPDNPDFAEFVRLFLKECEPARYGWKRIKLDSQQRDYVIQCEAVMRSILEVQRTDWKEIDISNKELAIKIRENALHALAVLARAMIQNENNILY